MKDPPLHGRGITDFLGWDGTKCNLVIHVIVSRKDHCITNFPVRRKHGSFSQEKWLGTLFAISEQRKGRQNAVLIPQTVILKCLKDEEHGL